ncbi:uncharacterized protein LOC142564933 [Dermacentor variabilis]|uniref:uncharacterized protein LOC142564933 n=1 Tax=Dermacentor variabilis TaxID=34621 RepID=UPI003F5CB4FD
MWFRCSDVVLLVEFSAWVLSSCSDAYRMSLGLRDDQPRTSAQTWSKNSRFLHLLHVVRFPNLMCTGTWGQEGTCYAFKECMERGGTAYGQCAFGFGVCCSLTASCRSMITLNSTYFSSPGFHAAPGATQTPPSGGDGDSSGVGGQSTCAVQVFKLSDRICQIRLDFDEFDLERPTVGNCDGEKLIVTGQNANNVVPPLCGLNTGQHLYIDVDMSPGPVNLYVETNGTRNSRWNIKISQIKCDSPSRAPSNCLQYYTGVSGNFSSFDYAEAQEIPPRRGYLNNLDYTVCFRKEAGFCSITYSVPGMDVPFSIQNVGADNAPTTNETEAGLGVAECTMDYLLLGGVRYCGTKLNPSTEMPNPVINAPVTDMTSGPFTARFVSDGALNARGFLLNYMQNPC